MKEELIQRIFKCISNTLQIPYSDVNLDLTAGSIPQWDSLGHLSIISAIEEEFFVKFEQDQLFNLQKVKDIVELLDCEDN